MCARITDFKDRGALSMANGKKLSFNIVDGKVTVNDANIVASIPASNGVVQVINAVPLPPAQ